MLTDLFERFANRSYLARFRAASGSLSPLDRAPSFIESIQRVCDFNDGLEDPHQFPDQKSLHLAQRRIPGHNPGGDSAGGLRLDRRDLRTKCFQSRGYVRPGACELLLCFGKLGPGRAGEPGFGVLAVGRRRTLNPQSRPSLRAKTPKLNPEPGTALEGSLPYGSSTLL